MVKLGGLLLSARLSKLTAFKPKTRNVTRWSSTYGMLTRYVQIRELLPLLNSDTIHYLLLAASENRHIDSIISSLQPLNSVTKQLKDDNITVSDCRTFFDAVIEIFPETTCRLTSTAGIVACPIFESGIVKLQRNNVGLLAREETEALSGIVIEQNRENLSIEDGMSFAQRALKRQKLCNSASERKYIDTRFILATSNIVERLFSKTGHTFTDKRN